MRDSIAFSSRHLNHERIAQEIFETFNVREIGFGIVRFKLNQMGITNVEDIKKVTDLVMKKLDV
jgi:hypothetical protein